MIQYQGKVVGSIWADLEQVGNVPAPAIHIMIGDPEARGKGVGFAAASKVIDHLHEKGFESIFSRHLASNGAASGLLKSLGFAQFGKQYTDEDGLEWQNVVKTNHKLATK
jgi:RimJ/RimL family protein N-acetyltransferase